MVTYYTLLVAIGMAGRGIKARGLVKEIGLNLLAFIGGTVGEVFVLCILDLLNYIISY